MSKKEKPDEGVFYVLLHPTGREKKPGLDVTFAMGKPQKVPKKWIPVFDADPRFAKADNADVVPKAKLDDMRTAENEKWKTARDVYRAKKAGKTKEFIAEKIAEAVALEELAAAKKKEAEAASTALADEKTAAKEAEADEPAPPPDPPAPEAVPPPGVLKPGGDGK